MPLITDSTPGTPSATAFRPAAFTVPAISRSSNSTRITDDGETSLLDAGNTRVVKLGFVESGTTVVPVRNAFVEDHPMSRKRAFVSVGSAPCRSTIACVRSAGSYEWILTE